ncbi:MAG: hypothetical protein AVDCRST_MAG55-1258, partial [uncultured Rubrobacteraceae bacterium]
GVGRLDGSGPGDCYRELPRITLP